MGKQWSVIKKDLDPHLKHTPSTCKKAREGNRFCLCGWNARAFTDQLQADTTLESNFAKWILNSSHEPSPRLSTATTRESCQTSSQWLKQPPPREVQSPSSIYTYTSTKQIQGLWDEMANQNTPEKLIQKGGGLEKLGGRQLRGRNTGLPVVAGEKICTPWAKKRAG